MAGRNNRAGKGGKGQREKGKEAVGGVDSAAPGVGGDFRNLPQYLTPTNVSKAQQRKLINYLAEKPLKELRQNQSVIESQIGLLAKNTSFSTEQKTRIATDLQMKQRFYDAAVDRRVFDLGKKD